MWIHDDPLHIATRKLRATLAKCLTKPKAFSIGTSHTVRAIVVPIPNFNPWQPAARRASFADAKRAFALRLKAIKEASRT